MQFDCVELLHGGSASAPCRCCCTQKKSSHHFGTILAPSSELLSKTLTAVLLLDCLLHCSCSGLTCCAYLHTVRKGPYLKGVTCCELLGRAVQL